MTETKEPSKKLSLSSNRRLELKKSVETEMALGYAGGQQIELLGPGRNTTLYSEKIPTDGGITLHHVGIYHHGLERLRQDLPRAGFPTVVDLGLRLGLLTPWSEPPRSTGGQTPSEKVGTAIA